MPLESPNSADRSKGDAPSLTAPTNPASTPIGQPGASAFAAAWRLACSSAVATHDAALPDPPRAVVHSLVPVGLLVALGWVGVFRAAWRIFGDPELTHDRYIPALAVVILECLLTGPALVFGLTRALDPRAGLTMEPRDRPDPFSILIPVLYVMLLWTLIASFPQRVGWYPSRDDWRHFLNPLYPQAIYRPLLLAPIWGRWGLLLAAAVGRAASNADPLVRAVSGAVRPTAVARWLVAPATMTVLYTLRDGRGRFGGLVILLVLLTTYLAAMFLAHRHGGQTRQTLRACSAVAQLTFLLTFRALCV